MSRSILMGKYILNHTAFNIRGGHIMLIEGNVLCTFIILEKPNYIVKKTRSGRTA
jgi:hypothetical protein